MKTAFWFSLSSAVFLTVELKTLVRFKELSQAFREKTVAFESGNASK